MNIYSKSDIGLIRDSNQDSFSAESIGDNVALAVVCDGMGGVNGGDIASKIAADEISNHVLKNYNKDFNKEDIKELLEDAVNIANAKIYDKSKDDIKLQGMGTTVVAALVCDKELYIVHVGDSRAYIINDKEIKKLTIDHSIVQQMVLNGEITEKEAMVHPRKNIITRALGIANDIEVDYINLQIEEKDILLICTDGLTNYIEDEKLLSMFQNNRTDILADKLVSYAKDCGGSDNITVVIVCK